MLLPKTETIVPALLVYLNVREAGNAACLQKTFAVALRLVFPKKSSYFCATQAV
jgi:hypothetical protein